jgi:hypothetical protein
MEEQDFCWDLKGMLETHPAMLRDVRIFLQALCHHNPGVDRRVCAAMGGRIMAQLGQPTPGNERALMAAIEWLNEQTQGMRLVDTRNIVSRGLKASGHDGGDAS